MNKWLSVVPFVILVVFFTGCRKKRTCECTTTNNSNGVQVTTQTEFETTKSKGNDLCNELDKNEGDFTTDCGIK
jgi:hypothetical protein